ncbi:MAG: hypothetical protein F2796_00940 [Actinobacteria bacterium]|nr:hypothetical protein [Actinomycetota bacterium]
MTEFSAGITVGSYPVGIAAGADGNLWFTELGGPRIGRITPLGVVTEFSAGITALSGPTRLAPGPDGNMWFTEDNGGQIGRITTGVVPPAKPVVSWSSKSRTRSVTARIKPVAGVTYTLTARRGAKLKTGTCRNVTVKVGARRVARRSCTLKLAKGTWLASVTAVKSSLTGQANSRRFTFR